MSFTEQYDRLKASRDKIRKNLIEWQVTANSSATIDELADVIEVIENRGGITESIYEGSSFTIPAGYHNGAGVIHAITDVAGDKKRYLLQQKTVTPTKASVGVGPDQGYYGLESVTVNPIPEAYQNVTNVSATADDVVSGKIIVTPNGSEVAGNITNHGKLERVLDASNPSCDIKKGYYSADGKVSINPQPKTISHPLDKEKSTTVYPDANCVLSSVTIEPLPKSYGDVSDASVNGGSLSQGILKGTTVYAKDASGSPSKVEGTMVDHGAVTETVGWNKDFTIPRGFHNGNGKVSAKTKVCYVTPSNESQTIFAEADEAFAAVSVNKIPSNYTNTDLTTLEVYTNSYGDAFSSQLLDGVKAAAKYYDEPADLWIPCIVEGTMPNNTKVSQTLSTTKTSCSIRQGYHPNGGEVSIDLEEKSIDCPTDNTKATEITPTSGKVLSKVTINPLPISYANTSDATISPTESSNILAGETAYGYDTSTGEAVRITGTMVNQGKKTVTLDGLYTKSYTIPGGHHNGMGTVTFDDSEIAKELAKI